MKYEQRTTKPIVQALLNPAFEAALEALRPAWGPACMTFDMPSSSTVCSSSTHTK
jgi:hypothetical protein